MSGNETKFHHLEKYCVTTNELRAGWNFYSTGSEKCKSGTCLWNLLFNVVMCTMVYWGHGRLTKKGKKKKKKYRAEEGSNIQRTKNPQKSHIYNNKLGYSRF